VRTADGAGLSRRRALAVLGAGGSALVVAACTGKAAPAPIDPMTKDNLAALYTETIALIATYDLALAASPTLARILGPMREDHRQHAVAIASLVGSPDPRIPAGINPSGIPLGGTPPPADPSAPPTPSSTVAPVDPATSRATIVTAEKTAQLNSVKACNEADAARVAVLASIAASRATHVAALAAVR
jgi:hypothetical protein